MRIIINNEHISNDQPKNPVWFASQTNIYKFEAKKKEVI